MAQQSLRPAIRLVTGYEMPIVGYGVYQTPPDITEKVTTKALEVGYRHFDSAKYYKNEAECAEAIAKSGIDRSQIFYTSKVPHEVVGYEAAKQAVAESLAAAEKLGYIDLMLIHGPHGGKEARLGKWRALVEAQKTGKVRSIGVSNYAVKHLNELEEYINTGGGGQIAVGQYELHPWCPRDEIVAWLKQREAVVQAYAPVVRATRMDEPALKALAEKHGKTPSQILLRWSLQKGYVPLPKSVTDSRIAENFQVFDFKLSAEDMEKLNTGEYSPVCWDPVTTVTD